MGKFRSLVLSERGLRVGVALLALVFVLVGVSTLSAPPVDADVDCSVSGDDTLEENDDAGSATAMASGETLAAHACEGDPDFYAVEANVGDTIDVSVVFVDAEGDIDAYLNRPGGSNLAFGESVDDNETLSAVAVETGTHNIRVVIFTTGDDNNYQITVTVTPPCDAADVYEDNDGFGSATSVIAGTTYQAVACDDDIDFFTIFAAAGDTIDVLVEFDQVDGDVDAILLDPETVIHVTADSTTDDESMSLVAEASGMHYVRVYMKTAGSNEYALTVAVTTPDVNSFPYVETFGTATCELPTDWTQSPTNTENWLFGAPGGGSDPAAYGAQADHTDGTGCIAWINDSSLHDAGPASLLSPVFNLTSLTDPVLEFWYQNQSATSTEPTHSILSVDVFDGTGWVTDVLTVDAKIGEWTRYTVDLASYTSGLSQIRFNGTEQPTVFDSDISLDDVVVKERPLNDLAITSIVGPVTACQLNENVRVVVENVGVNVVSNAGISLIIDGTLVDVATLNGTLAAGDVAEFSPFVVVWSPGVHVIEVVLDDDDDLFSNTLEVTVDNLGQTPIPSFPYVESFEGTDGGWAARGLNSSWERGVPGGPSIDSAFDGSEVWATGLTTNYVNSDESYVRSPCFDFSGVAPQETANISLGLNYETELNFDGAALQYSTDFVTWTTLGALGDETNWHDVGNINGLVPWSGASADGWSGSSGGWRPASHSLQAVLGEPQVAFRVAFGSDPSVSKEGFAFDRVEISTSTPGGFVALNPARILDSRPGGLNVGAFDSPWGAGQTRAVQVTGVGGVPASGVDAVVLHVTTVSPTAAFSWLTVSPTGESPATTAVHNFGTAAFTSQIVNDVIIAKVGAGGTIDVRNEAGTVDLVFDVVGYSATDTGFGYEPLAPARILDSRSGPSNVGAFSSPWGADQTRAVQVTGVGGVPASGVEAVVVNVTTVSPSAGSSWLTVSPTGETPASTAAHNFGTAAALTEIVNDVIIAKVGTGGTIDVRNEAGTVDLVFDVVGYYATTGGFAYLPLNPERILDTRDNVQGDYSSPWAAGISRTVNTTFPDCADAVVLHVTTVGPSAAFSWLTITPTGEASSTTAAHNFGTAGFTTEIRNDIVIAKTGVNGNIDILNQAGTVDLVIDLVGVYGADDCVA